ncbi:hypothetical protein [Labilibaculum euxinus]
MKKLLLSLVICLGLVSFASQTFAQSTAVKPYDGAKHTYTFGDVEANATYKFYVSTSTVAYGVGSEVTDFGAFTGTGTGTIGAANGAASVEITWANNAAANYGASGLYLFLAVTVSGDPCSGPGNYKAVHIMPQASAFNLAVVDDSATDPTCADLTGLKPVINLTDINVTDEYDAGKTTLSYTITRTNSSNAWSGTYTVTSSDNTVEFTANTVASSSGLVSGSVTNETANTHVVTVVITNKPGSNPTFTLNLVTGSDDVTGVTDIDLTTADATADHTINLMPTIGSFTGI